MNIRDNRGHDQKLEAALLWLERNYPRRQGSPGEPPFPFCADIDNELRLRDRAFGADRDESD